LCEKPSLEAGKLNQASGPVIGHQKILLELAERTQAWDAHYFQSYRKEADPKYIKRASIGKFLFFDPVLLMANAVVLHATIRNMALPKIEPKALRWTA